MGDAARTGQVIGLCRDIETADARSRPAEIALQQGKTRK
jgi:hypothetical protein